MGTLDITAVQDGSRDPLLIFGNDSFSLHRWSHSQAQVVVAKYGLHCMLPHISSIASKMEFGEWNSRSYMIQHYYLNIAREYAYLWEASTP